MCGRRGQPLAPRDRAGLASPQRDGSGAAGRSFARALRVSRVDRLDGDSDLRLAGVHEEGLGGRGSRAGGSGRGMSDRRCDAAARVGVRRDGRGGKV